MRTLSALPGEGEGGWKPKHSLVKPVHRLTHSCALTSSLVEGWHPGRPRDVWGRTELSGFSVGTGGTGATVVPVWNLTHMLPTKGQNFSGLSLPPKS